MPLVCSYLTHDGAIKRLIQLSGAKVTCVDAYEEDHDLYYEVEGTLEELQKFVDFLYNRKTILRQDEGDDYYYPDWNQKCELCGGTGELVEDDYLMRGLELRGLICKLGTGCRLESHACDEDCQYHGDICEKRRRPPEEGLSCDYYVLKKDES